MYKNLKYIIHKIEYLISKAFFGSQARFRELLIDYFFSFIDPNIKSNKEFDIIKGKVSGKLEFDKKTSSWGQADKTHAESYRLDYLPEPFLKIIGLHMSELTSYLGKDFICDEVLCFRTKNMPIYLDKIDIYSNIWHQDSNSGNRMLKIFFLISKTSMADGPLIFLNRKKTIENWHILRDRYKIRHITANFKVDGEDYFVGEPGNYVILDTSRCLHRASIPKDYRDMAQVTLYPKWRKNKVKKILKVTV